MGKILIEESEKIRIKNLYNISEQKWKQQQTWGPIPFKNKSPKLPMYKPLGLGGQISQQGLNLVKKHENFKPEEYICPSGKPTIGYGTRVDLNPELKGKKISDEVATGYVRKEMNDVIIPFIGKNVKIPLIQPQLDALASLIYNIGTGNFKKSQLLNAINSNDEEGIKKNWEEFKLSKGRVLPGLEKRREDDLNLFIEK